MNDPNVLPWSCSTRQAGTAAEQASYTRSWNMMTAPPEPSKLRILKVPKVIMLRRDLTPTDKAVYGYLASTMNAKGVSRFLRDVVARNLEISVDTFDRSLKRLERNRLIRHTRTGGASEYHLLWQKCFTAGIYEWEPCLADLHPGDRIPCKPAFVFFKLRLQLLHEGRLRIPACLLYAVLESHGRSGRCYPEDETLGCELGVDICVIRKLRKDLNGYIDYDQNRRCDYYRFLRPDLIERMVEQGVRRDPAEQTVRPKRDPRVAPPPGSIANLARVATRGRPTPAIPVDRISADASIAPDDVVENKTPAPGTTCEVPGCGRLATVLVPIDWTPAGCAALCAECHAHPSRAYDAIAEYWLAHYDEAGRRVLIRRAGRPPYLLVDRDGQMPPFPVHNEADLTAFVIAGSVALWKVEPMPPKRPEAAYPWADAANSGTDAAAFGADAANLAAHSKEEEIKGECEYKKIDRAARPSMQLNSSKVACRAEVERVLKSFEKFMPRPLSADPKAVDLMTAALLRRGYSSADFEQAAYRVFLRLERRRYTTPPPTSWNYVVASVGRDLADNSEKDG